MGTKIALKKVSFTVTKGSNNAAFTGNARSLAILDKFERQEKTGKERKQKLKLNKAVRGMQKAFKEILVGCWSIRTVYVNSDISCQKIDSFAFSYTARDIGIFSMALDQFQDNKEFPEAAGMFLSAMINKSKEKDFVISTVHLSNEIAFLGYMNMKKITVNGDLGNNTGWWMKGGKMTVNGDTGSGIGWEMKGGTIVVNGNIDSVGGHDEGGNIYQFEKQLVKEGELVAYPKNK